MTEEYIINMYAEAVWYGVGLAIARSWVQIPLAAAVYQRQLSVPSFWSRLMSSLPAKAAGSKRAYHAMQ